MEIVIVTAVFPPEPVVSAQLSFDIAEKLSVNKNVTVISPIPSRPFGFKFSKELGHRNFSHHILESYTCPSSNLFGRIIESYSFGRYSYRYISENQKHIGVIYINTWPLFSQYFTIKAARKFNIPTIIHIQDIYPESLGNKIPLLKNLINFILLPIDKYVLQNATRIVAISEKMKHHLSTTRRIAKEKIDVVLNWQDEEKFILFNEQNLPAQKDDAPFTFMYLGNVGPVAGIEWLISTYVQAKILNARLVIAGSGSMKESLQKSVKENKYDNIEFWPVPEGMVPEIQNHADVMILPIQKGAASSSIPSKLPAYMFSGKPIIACVDVNSDTANAVISAECGWVTPPEDQNALIQKLVMVTSLEKDELQMKGLSGCNYSLDHFSKKKNLKRMIDIINQTATS